MSTNPRPTRRATPIALPVAVLVVVVDQLTKHWALNALDSGPKHVIWTLQFNLAFNSGMAFSRGQGAGPIIGALALVVVVAMVVGLARNRGARRSWSIAIGLIVGGAAGNLIDRLFRGDGWLHGSVIDFIDFQWWPIFNVADMGITIGGAWLLIGTALAGRQEKAAALASTEADETNEAPTVLHDTTAGDADEPHDDESTATTNPESSHADRG